MTYFLAKLLLNLSTKFVTNFITIYITKFGDSQKSSLNLVNEFAQYFPLFLFLKKIHQNGHDICHQIWWFTKPITKFDEKNRTFLITIHPSGPSSEILELRKWQDIQFFIEACSSLLGLHPSAWSRFIAFSFFGQYDFQLGFKVASWTIWFSVKF